MTIRRYLFLLFSALLLIIAITQLALLYAFKANIANEIDKRSRDFADVIINFAVNNLEQSNDKQNHEQGYLYKPNNSSQSKDYVIIEVEHEQQGQEFELSFDVPLTVLQQPQQLASAITDVPEVAQAMVLNLSAKFINGKSRKLRTQQGEFEVKIFKPRDSHRHWMKKQLRSQINKFKKDKDFTSGTQVKSHGVTQHTRSWHKSRQERHQAGLINKMFNAIFIVIALTTVIALILAFWLSRKFSQPLAQLSQGFVQLEQGQFGIKLKPAGTEELKQTMQRFNLMSEQLVKLAEAEHKLLQQQHLMELSDVSKGIAHALRNPIHTIGLAAEQLQQDSISPELKLRLLDKINSKIRQLNKNITALLTVTSGHLDRSEQVNLLAVVQDVVLELKQSHQQTLPALNVDVNIAQQAYINGSEKELRSVIHTLLFNAYEAACESNQEQIKIAIEVAKHKGELSLSVRDNGNGVKDQIMAQMFEPHNSSKAEGAGMGLYLSKRIIELHYDGRLTINNSNAEQGYTGAIATIAFSQSEKNTKRN